jgi:putative ABC transport system permease protein
MKGFGFGRLLATDLQRFGRRFALAGGGIALATAVLVSLLGFGEGLRLAVLGLGGSELDLEVSRGGGHVNLGPLRLGLGQSGIDDAELRDLRGLPGVTSVGGRVGLRAPAVATGGAALLGETLVTEVVVEGLDPVVLDSVDGFSDRGPADPAARPCFSDASCDPGLYCVDTVTLGKRCREPLPVVVSLRLVDLYNGVVRRAYGLPQLNEEAAVGLGADVRFGTSSFSTASRGRGLRERVVLVGFSDRVSPMALTAPLEEVRRLNRAFQGGDELDGAVVRVASRSDLGPTMNAIEAMGLDIAESIAEAVAGAVGLARLALAGLGLAVLAIAAVGTLHAFALLMASREREIAILRAVGATRFQVVRLVAIEAGLVGLAAGLTGWFLGWSGSQFLEGRLQQAAQALPLPAMDLVAFPLWIPAVVVGLAVLASVVGALAPMLGMLRRDPSRIV